MKKLFLLVALVIFISCKKEPEALGSKHLGTYSCMEIEYVAGPGSHVDTLNSNVTVEVGAWADRNYLVILPGFSFHTTSRDNKDLGKYYSDCANGPCPTVTFYAGDSIRVARKISNPVSKVYIGKKQ